MTVKPVARRLNVGHTHRKLVWVDPVVFRELHVELDVKVTFLEGVPVLRHPLAPDHADTPCRR